MSVSTEILTGFLQSAHRKSQSTGLGMDEIWTKLKGQLGIDIKKAITDTKFQYIPRPDENMDDLSAQEVAAKCVATRDNLIPAWTERLESITAETTTEEDDPEEAFMNATETTETEPPVVDYKAKLAAAMEAKEAKKPDPNPELAKAVEALQDENKELREAIKGLSSIVKTNEAEIANLKGGIEFVIDKLTNG